MIRAPSRRTLERIGPPLAVFVIVRLFLIRIAAANGIDGRTAGAWSHWDSAHYLAIAESGYEFFSCARLPGYDPTKFCGNTGWLPGFPLLIRALTALHIDPLVAGSTIAAVFALATLFVLWNAFLGPQLSAAGVCALFLAGFFPGHVYQHALFPVSMCAFFQTASLYAHATRRSAWAGVLGGVAAFSYGSGLFMAGVLGLDLLLGARSESFRVLLRRLILEPGLVVLGFAAALFVQWRDAGVWNGYFLVQEKYGYGPTPPWRSLAPHVTTLIESGAHTKPPSIQTVFLIAFVPILVWAAFRAPREPRDRVLAVFMLAYWLIPLSLGGNLSLYRAEAVLLPSAPLARKLPFALLIALLIAAIAIAGKMAPLFFRNTLV